MDDKSTTPNPVDERWLKATDLYYKLGILINKCDPEIKGSQLGALCGALTRSGMITVVGNPYLWEDEWPA